MGQTEQLALWVDECHLSIDCPMFQADLLAPSQGHTQTEEKTRKMMRIKWHLSVSCWDRVLRILDQPVEGPCLGSCAWPRGSKGKELGYQHFKDPRVPFQDCLATIYLGLNSRPHLGQRKHLCSSGVDPVIVMKASGVEEGQVTFIRTKVDTPWQYIAIA